MLIQLVGGPLDGQRMECPEGMTHVRIPQHQSQPITRGEVPAAPQEAISDNYVRILHGVFISMEIPQEEMLNAVAQKLVDGYSLAHRVGMAVTQLDDALMYADKGGHVAKAKDLLCTINY